MTFKAPSGSGFTGGLLKGMSFKPALTKDFDLALGLAVTGRIRDGSGTPLSGAKVSFRSSESAPEVDSDSTNGAGTYSVRLTPGKYVAVIESGLSTLGKKTVHGVSVGKMGPLQIDFQFGSPVSVAGTVAEEFGPAVPNAQLDFTGTESGVQATVVCDGSGLYSTTLVPDVYSVVVTPAGSAASTHLKQRWGSFTVASAASRDFLLISGAQVSGTVLDNLGMPLLEDTEIKIKVAQGSNFYAPSKVQSNSVDGTYSIGPVPLETVTFELEPPDDSGFPTKQIQRQISGPSTQIEDLMLSAGFVLSGTVLTNTLAPEKDVEVQAIPRNGSFPPDDDDTDSSGFYDISLLPGTYDVTFTPDPSNLQIPMTQVVVVAGNGIVDVTLALGADLMGTVMEPGGAGPADDIQVEIEGTPWANDETNGSGAYSFLAPAGTHVLKLEAHDGPFKNMALAPVAGVVVATPGPVTEDFTLQLALTGKTVVQGTTYEPDGSTPIAGVEVVAQDKKTGAIIGRAISAMDGTYVLVIL